MSTTIQFFRGILSKIKAHTIQDGALYLNTNTNCLFVDNNKAHNPINAYNLYDSNTDKKIHITGSYLYTFDTPTATTEEGISYLTTPPEGLSCGGLNESGNFIDFIPPVIIPIAEDTDYDYVVSAEVIDRNSGGTYGDKPIWMINFIIKLPEGRAEVEPFSVIILDSK